jgi:hypothetical protein
MERAIAIADRAAPQALKIVAAVNLLFFAAFLATLIVAARAHPDLPQRVGGDIMSGLAGDTPDHLYGFAAFHP